MTKIIDEHLSGEGTQANPYVIHDSTGLGYLSGANLGDYGVNKYYELGADIDMSSVANFTPIGDDSVTFTGHFDGKNHTISNMTVYFGSSESHPLGVGFISRGAGCTISNIVFTNFYGYCNSRVGDTGLSVLIGALYTSASISNITCKNCILYNGVAMIETGFIAGLFAYTTASYVINNCAVTNCYAGSVENVGGIVGYSMGSSSSAGSIIISNCVIDSSTIRANAERSSGVVGTYYGAVIPNISNCTVSNCCIYAGSSKASGIMSDFS